VRDHDAGEGGLVEQGFKPGDAGEVEVVGGLVEEKNVGVGDDGLGDGEALAPAAGEEGGFGREGGEADAAGGLAQATFAVSFWDGGGGEGGFEDLADGEAGGVGGLLADVGDAGALAGGEVAGVGLLLAGEDGEEGGLAGAVGANEADAVGVGDGEGDVFEEGLRAKAFGEALGVEDWRHR
jgi:hypothetical protein